MTEIWKRISSHCSLGVHFARCGLQLTAQSFMASFRPLKTGYFPDVPVHQNSPLEDYDVSFDGDLLGTTDMLLIIVQMCIGRSERSRW